LQRRTHTRIQGGEANHMETRQFGKTDMQVTPVGLGAWAIGGAGWRAGWGAQDDDDSVATIHRALDVGINWIDTAAVYGLGHSEEIVERALRGRSDRPYVFTKCGRVWDESGTISGRLKADSIRQEVEDSLRRLNIDVIDLYQVHWPDPDEDIEEGWTALAELQAAGKLRYIGVSNFNADQMRRAQAIASIASLQPPYSLLRRDIEAEVLPYCQEHNIAVIVYSPMQSGLLSGKMTRERAANLPKDDWRSGNENFREPKLSHNLELADKLRAIAEPQGATAGAAAIAWTLRHPAVTAAIVGARHPDQLDDIVKATTLTITDEQAAELEAFA
jgi:aryl-alcohol dehydrogenase-like predicted oxidoreductase